MTELALAASRATSRGSISRRSSRPPTSCWQSINDMLDFSKIAAGKLELDGAEFSLATP